jgi:hypothetical protein
MRRVRDTRLARLAAESTRVDTTAGLDDCTLTAWRTVRAVVRDGLLRAGIDPACATALRLDEAAATTTELGATLELRALEETWTDPDGLAAVFAAKIGEVARGFRDGHDPDFGSASLAELLAWCLWRGGYCSG